MAVVTSSLLCLSGCGRGGAEEDITLKLNSMGRSKGNVFPDREDYYGVFVLDENTAWAVGSRGIILRITDKGERVATLPTWVEKALYDIDFTDAQTGLAIGQDGLISKTGDGGENWEQLEVELA